MSAFEDLFDPDLNFIAVTQEHLQQASEAVKSYESCNPNAEIPFDWLLAAIEGLGGYIDYIIASPAKCPKCGAEIHETTLIEAWEGRLRNW